MNSKLGDFDKLREAAEAKLTCQRQSLQMPRTPERVLHELQVHQVELEIQNEQLRQSQIELEKARDLYVDFYNFAPVGYLTLNEDGIIEDINITGAALLGETRNKLPYHRFASYVSPEDRDRWYLHFHNTLKHDGTMACEVTLRHDSKSCICAQLDCLRVRKGGHTQVRVALTNVTKEKRMVNKLLEMQKLMDEVQQISKLGGWKYDCATRHITWSEEVYRIYGVGRDFDPDNVNNDINFYSPEDKLTITEAFSKAIKDGVSYDLELQFIRANGEHIWVRTIGKPTMTNGKVVSVAGNIMDITERKLAQEQIYKLAFFDSLTELPNRRLLNDRIVQAMASSKRSGCYNALLFLDLDNFKPLNDMHGHSMGDSLLVEAARRISSCVREMDTVARFGGDEFVVLLCELNEDKGKSVEQAKFVAEKINAVLSEPYSLTGQQIGETTVIIEHHCTSSIGVEMFTNHEVSAEDILMRADKAMYRAKEAGRNFVKFDESQD